MDYKKDQDKITSAYKHLFETENGKVVLSDLESFCGYNRSSVCEQHPDTNQTMYAEGKRRVYLRIRNILDRKLNE